MLSHFEAGPLRDVVLTNDISAISFFFFFKTTTENQLAANNSGVAASRATQTDRGREGLCP